MLAMHGGHGYHVTRCSYGASAILYERAMPAAAVLAHRLQTIMDADPATRDIMDRFVAELRTRGVGLSAPQVGETFPDFSLPDAEGRYVSLHDLLHDGPVVLSFSRGGWCPYCVDELGAWSEVIPALIEAGGRFVAIVSEVAGRAAAFSASAGKVVTLCDVDHGLALTAGLAFHVGPEMAKQFAAWGLDLKELYGSESGLLPVPATFVVDQEQVVRFAAADPDFRQRAEPADVIELVATLRRGGPAPRA